MNSRVSAFMSDFLLAASDYERLDETVHDFIDNGSPMRIDEFSHRISDALVNAKKSITAAVASGSDAKLVDELPEDIRDDVRFALKMSVHWMERVKLLESMLRALVMETDADYIELMVRARRNLAMMGIQEDFSDNELEEESEEGEDAEDDYSDDELFEPRIEHNIDDGPEDESEPVYGPEPVPEEEDEPLEVFPESEPDFIHIGELPSEPRIVNGLEDDTLVPGEIHEDVPEPPTDYHEGLPDEETVQRILPPAQNPVPTSQSTTPEGQSLTKEDVAGIVLDVITDLLRPEQTAQPQRIDINEPEEEEELKPAPRKKPSTRKTTAGKKTTTRKTTGRKTSGKKSPVDKVLDILKKDEEESE